MKHLNKYNEAISTLNKKFAQLDKVIIDYIFAEFLDEGSISKLNNPYSYEIEISSSKYIVSQSINDTLKNIDSLKEIFLDIDVCLKRIHDEYLDLDYYIYNSSISGDEMIIVYLYYKNSVD